jgi:hypothetical protein
MRLHEVIESILMASEDATDTPVLSSLVEMLLKCQKPTLKKKKPCLSVLTEGARSEYEVSRADFTQASATSLQQFINPDRPASTLLTKDIGPHSSIDIYEVRRRSRTMTDELSMCKLITQIRTKKTTSLGAASCCSSRLKFTCPPTTQCSTLYALMTS